MNISEQIFKCICETLTLTFESQVVKTKEIASFLGLSIYKTRKGLKFLVETGMIEKHSEGCPAVYTYEGECIHENYPPRNGWTITKKGMESDIYKEKKKQADKAFSEWANG